MRFANAAVIVLSGIVWVPENASASPGSSPPVDPSVRSDVIRYYYETYLASEGYTSRHGWTGNLAACNAGTLSSTIQDDVIRRVNYFRAMAGLPAEITLSPTLNAKSQQAALMMAYNGALNHYPPTSWACYTADGAEAAANSNLSLGFNTPFYGPQAVTGQIEDDGNGNESVGHRRWILNTRAPDQMGHGSIPLTPTVGNPAQTTAAMALWVSGPSTSTLPDDFEFVAWPPAGFVPSTLAFQRWSFGLVDDSTYSPDFSAATVTMTTGGGGVPLTIIHRGSSPTSNEPTIVWEASGFPLAGPPATDQVYTVTVSGIAGAPRDSYTYQVTVINENALTPIQLSGSDGAYVGHDNIYTFTPMPAAGAYELRVAATSNGDWTEGGEAAPVPKVIDSTHPSYPLTTTALQASGTSSFHVLEQQDTFEIDREIMPSATSQLTFSQRFRYVGTGMYLCAEVEATPGNWTEVWRRHGRHGFNVVVGDWDTSWTPVSVPLAAYAGETVRVRFRYVYESGADWTPIPGDNPNELGAFIDNVQVSDSLELQGESFQQVGAGASSVAFHPASTGEYYLQLRAQVGGKWFGFGPETVVTAVVGTPPSMRLTATGIDGGGGFFIEVEAQGYSAFTVHASEDGGAQWAADDRFVPSQPSAGTHRFTAPFDGQNRIFRVIANE